MLQCSVSCGRSSRRSKHATAISPGTRRAASSVTPNVAERSSSRGRTRSERYRNALGSARELDACLDTAEALAHVEAIDERARLALHHVQGTVVRVVV